jgi:hypothetical protein
MRKVNLVPLCCTLGAQVKYMMYMIGVIEDSCWKPGRLVAVLQ